MAVIERHVLAESAAFFAKKTAKKLARLGGAAPAAPTPAVSRSFLLRFLQKSSASFHFQPPLYAAS
jgi:hypothetical protein